MHVEDGATYLPIRRWHAPEQLPGGDFDAMDRQAGHPQLLAIGESPSTPSKGEMIGDTCLPASMRLCLMIVAEWCYEEDCFHNADALKGGLDDGDPSWPRRDTADVRPRVGWNSDCLPCARLG
jgi:hypothetical protein